MQKEKKINSDVSLHRDANCHSKTSYRDSKSQRVLCKCSTNARTEENLRNETSCREASGLFTTEFSCGHVTPTWRTTEQYATIIGDLDTDGSYALDICLCPPRFEEVDTTKDGKVVGVLDKYVNELHEKILSFGPSQNNSYLVSSTRKIDGSKKLSSIHILIEKDASSSSTNDSVDDTKCSEISKEILCTKVSPSRTERDTTVSCACSSVTVLEKKTETNFQDNEIRKRKKMPNYQPECIGNTRPTLIQAESDGISVTVVETSTGTSQADTGQVTLLHTKPEQTCCPSKSASEYQSKCFKAYKDIDLLQWLKDLWRANKAIEKDLEQKSTDNVVMSKDTCISRESSEEVSTDKQKDNTFEVSIEESYKQKSCNKTNDKSSKNQNTKKSKKCIRIDNGTYKSKDFKMKDNTHKDLIQRLRNVCSANKAIEKELEQISQEPCTSYSRKKNNYKKSPKTQSGGGFVIKIINDKNVVQTLKEKGIVIDDKLGKISKDEIKNFPKLDCNSPTWRECSKERRISTVNIASNNSNVYRSQDSFSAVPTDESNRKKTVKDSCKFNNENYDRKNITTSDYFETISIGIDSIILDGKFNEICKQNDDLKQKSKEISKSQYSNVDLKKIDTNSITKIHVSLKDNFTNGENKVCCDIDSIIKLEKSQTGNLVDKKPKEVLIETNVSNKDLINQLKDTIVREINNSGCNLNEIDEGISIDYSLFNEEIANFDDFLIENTFPQVENGENADIEMNKETNLKILGQFSIKNIYGESLEIESNNAVENRLVDSGEDGFEILKDFSNRNENLTPSMSKSMKTDDSRCVQCSNHFIEKLITKLKSVSDTNTDCEIINEDIVQNSESGTFQVNCNASMVTKSKCIDISNSGVDVIANTRFLPGRNHRNMDTFIIAIKSKCTGMPSNETNKDSQGASDLKMAIPPEILSDIHQNKTAGCRKYSKTESTDDISKVNVKGGCKKNESNDNISSTSNQSEVESNFKVDCKQGVPKARLEGEKHNNDKHFKTCNETLSDISMEVARSDSVLKKVGTENPCSCPGENIENVRESTDVTYFCDDRTSRSSASDIAFFCRDSPTEKKSNCQISDNSSVVSMYSFLSKAPSLVSCKSLFTERAASVCTSVCSRCSTRFNSRKSDDKFSSKYGECVTSGNTAECDCCTTVSVISDKKKPEPIKKHEDIRINVICSKPSILKTSDVHIQSVEDGRKSGDRTIRFDPNINVKPDKEPENDESCSRTIKNKSGKMRKFFRWKKDPKDKKKITS